jgi:hypothetical protein
MNNGHNVQMPATEIAEPKPTRLVKVRFHEVTRVVEFRIFVSMPDGRVARVLGGGVFEEQDLDRVLEELDALYHGLVRAAYEKMDDCHD